MRKPKIVIASVVLVLFLSSCRLVTMFQMKVPLIDSLSATITTTDITYSTITLDVAVEYNVATTEALPTGRFKYRYSVNDDSVYDDAYSERDSNLMRVYLSFTDDTAVGEEQSLAFTVFVYWDPFSDLLGRRQVGEIRQHISFVRPAS